MPYIHPAKRYYLIIVYRGEQFTKAGKEASASGYVSVH